MKKIISKIKIFIKKYITKDYEKSTDVYVDPRFIDVDTMSKEHGRVFAKDENDVNNQIATIVGFHNPESYKVHQILYGAVPYNYEKCGEVVKAKSDGRLGVILYEINETKQVVVLHEINPFVYCTYDSYDMLDKLYAFSKRIERRSTPR